MMTIANWLLYCGCAAIAAAVWNYDWRLGLGTLGLIAVGIGILISVRK
jgi:hypothetical protein